VPPERVTAGTAHPPRVIHDKTDHDRRHVDFISAEANGWACATSADSAGNFLGASIREYLCLAQRFNGPALAKPTVCRGKLAAAPAAPDRRASRWRRVCVLRSALDAAQCVSRSRQFSALPLVGATVVPEIWDIIASGRCHAAPPLRVAYTCSLSGSCSAGG
jgi:hypothetical protein